MINARLETAAEKPMFKSFFQARRCLVLTDDCYEWCTVGGQKQPYRITLKTGEPFAMACIYAREPTEFETTEKNHQGMPVILPLGREKSWLLPDPTGMFMFAGIPAELLTSYPVTPKMNRASFNEPTAILPLEPALQLSAP
jgi:putative SOS response-associated peptidase YedK